MGSVSRDIRLYAGANMNEKRLFAVVLAGSLYLSRIRMDRERNPALANRTSPVQAAYPRNF